MSRTARVTTQQGRQSQVSPDGRNIEPVDEPVEAWDLCFEEGHCAGVHRSLFAGVRVWDGHLHLGRDRDGHVLDDERIFTDMNRFGVEKAVVFPLDEPGPRHDFREANAAVLGAAGRHSGRLIPFFRLNPWSDWRREYERCLGLGFRGIKLHPRAQRFAIDGPVADPIFAQAELDRLPVLVHTGFGIDRPGERLAAVVTRHPALRLLAGHSCLAELERGIRVLAPHENVWFETSMVPVYDLLQLLDRVGPKRLVLGSDAPYGALAVALQALIGAAAIIDASRESVRPVLGDNLARLLGEW